MNFILLLNVCIILLSITVSDGKKRSKIVGIVLSHLSTYPYLVSLQYRELHFCTGVILGSRHILTTASCVLIDRGILYANLKILSGTPDVGNSANDGQYYDVKYTACHEDYNPHQFFKNDICILVGDSGSPLTYRKKITGIVSAILLDCPTSLFIYTNVVEYSRWIKSSMEIY
ncbi:hypothetical protein HCN44_005871 [Aphidius gifuensis]|uniref:Peptidase S1 domain-containing protein n=1 Tax=Aphidius gifuensis TaxID=684658 RepID=A0A834XTB4_APHGI|nr:hypothetical protein HCN44_005871 [Aphidius gifuensis]